MLSKIDKNNSITQGGEDKIPLPIRVQNTEYRIQNVGLVAKESE
jgi:hypothetical protein